MRLHVVHETTYAYAPAVRMAQHVAHLRPRDDGGQRLLEHHLSIDPAPAERREEVDAYGNVRCFFALASAHSQLRVRAASVVETGATSALPGHATRADLPWEDARERFRFRRGGAFDAAAEFLFSSPYVPRDEAFAAYARPSFEAGRPLAEAARELAARIHADFAYESAATDAGTPALEALHLRRGVCQDFAHVMLGCLRSLGLPARYVSGYLLTEPPPGQPRLVGSDASHAWVQVYVPGMQGAGNWLDLDPTNDRTAGEDYVRLAIGRDYADVSPVRGVIQGGAHHTLQVAVTVAPLEPGQAPPLRAG